MMLRSAPGSVCDVRSHPLVDISEHEECKTPRFMYALRNDLCYVSALRLAVWASDSQFTCSVLAAFFKADQHDTSPVAMTMPADLKQTLFRWLRKTCPGAVDATRIPRLSLSGIQRPGDSSCTTDEIEKLGSVQSSPHSLLISARDVEILTPLVCYCRLQARSSLQGEMTWPSSRYASETVEIALLCFSQQA
jgi:hypothetical protein